MKKNYYLLFLSFTFLAAFWLAPLSTLNAQKSDSNETLQKVNDNTYLLNDIEILTDERTVSFPCKVNMVEGLIEVVLCTPKGKTHESLLVTGVSPVEFQTALLLLGLDPVNEVPDDPDLADPMSNLKSIETPGDSMNIFIETAINGKTKRSRIEDFIRDEPSGKTLKKSTWLFRGAATHQSGQVVVDPETTMIATYHDPFALMELNSKSKFNDELFYVNESLNLTKGQAVTLIIQAIQ
jgi:hypothetical protein